MEKSFLNFKAAHPEWQPTDPSGSLYLNRMADFTIKRGAHGTARRRFPLSASGAIMGDRRFTDRAQKYEHVLQQSQNAAHRRRNPSKSGIVISESVTAPTAPTSESTRPSSASGFAAKQTAVLQESQVNPFSRRETNDIPPEDLAQDEDIRSELGESYVDGKVTRGRSTRQSNTREQNDDGKLEDGGMLGLLAQIYGTRGPGYARVL